MSVAPETHHADGLHSADPLPVRTRTHVDDMHQVAEPVVFPFNRTQRNAIRWLMSQYRRGVVSESASNFHQCALHVCLYTPSVEDVLKEDVSKESRLKETTHKASKYQHVVEQSLTILNHSNKNFTHHSSKQDPNHHVIDMIIF